MKRIQYTNGLLATCGLIWYAKRFKTPLTETRPKEIKGTFQDPSSSLKKVPSRPQSPQLPPVISRKSAVL